MPTSDTAPHCHVCESLDQPVPDSVIFREELWSGCTAGDVPGWVRVQTNRHGDWLWDLTAAEAAALGPLVNRVSAAIRSVSDAETVYLIALGENSKHAHFLLIPRRADDETRGPGVLAQAAEMADAGVARHLAGLLRDRLVSGTAFDH